MPQRWSILPAPPESFLDAHPELPSAVASLLYNRKLDTQAAIDEFLYPDYSLHVHDPFLFRDMNKAVSRIFRAIEQNEKITIHGDYDADGVSASVILTSLFRALDYKNFDVFLPHRETDGYGLNVKTIQLLADGGTKIIISCDCGISNREEVVLANELGVDVIITDHHAIPKELPPAYAIIHPKIETETYPDKTLAGGGVAFKLMQGILKKHKETNELLPNGKTHEAFEKWQLDMVAIASVADMVPLLGESRTLTKYGLIVLNKTKRIGLQKLLLEARLMAEDGTLSRELDADTIGFRIAPRINAAGRMNHANVAYNLLVTEDPINAVNLAFELNQNNTDRQKTTDEWVRQASQQVKENGLEAPVLLAFHKDWSAGVVGLIASRLKDQFQRPVIAMTKNQGQIMGSGRSIDGFNLIAVLQENPTLFVKFGGHPMACGFTLAKDHTREELSQILCDAFSKQATATDLTPTLNIDAEITLDEVTWELYDILDKFEPFGQANPKPKYMARAVTILGVEPIGKDGKHLRLLVRHTSNKLRKVLGWNLCGTNSETNWCTTLKSGDKIDMVFEIGVNEWNGNRELQLTIVDLKKSDI